MKLKNLQHFSRYSNKKPSEAERCNSTIRDLFKKPVFQRGDANCVKILPSVIKKIILPIIAQQK